MWKLSITIIVMLIGLASPVYAQETRMIGQVERRENKFDDYIVYKSQTKQTSWGSFFLVAAKSKTGKPEKFALIAQVSTGTPLAAVWFATAEGGVKLKTETGKFDVFCFLGCSMSFRVGAELNRKMLASRRRSGLDIQLAAPKAEIRVVAEIPAEFIDQVLSAYGK
jgi:hypothetical protein